MLLLGLIVVVPAFAAGSPQTAPENANKLCLECHSIPERKVTLPSGEVLPLVIDGSTYDASVHGQKGIRCIDCHINIRGYPHPPLAANNYRDFQFDRYRSCFPCHTEQYHATLDSVHHEAMSADNRDAPICTDCHGAHDVSDPTTPRQKISQTCSKCHAAIFEQYRNSVHGAALMADSNPDVPTCVDCHSVHNVGDPHSAKFRLTSPQTCGHCHADAELMSKYGISTAVFDTYVADFHGTTVTLFERESPDQPTNKAVCFDCHGVHNIKAVTDPESSVVRENLLVTCQRCHPDADISFPASWTSHYIPDKEHTPLVYYVNLFYRYFIPSVVGFMVFVVLFDARKRLSRRLARRRKAPSSEAGS